MTLVFFAVAPILAVLVWLASRYFRRVSHRIQLAMGRVSQRSSETFKNISLVKSYSAEEFESKRFEEAADENLKLSTKFERVDSLQVPVMHSVIALDLAVIFLLVLLFWEGSAGEAVAYVSAAGLIAKPFRQLSSVNSIIQKALAGADTIFTTLDKRQEINSGEIILQQAQGEIIFDNVSFSYPLIDSKLEAPNKTLDKFSLHICPGETIAFVGESGSGKSTLMSLLLRFYHADSGRILIDNHDLEHIDLKSLRNNIALVNQQTMLMNESVEANVAYAKNQTDFKKLGQALENASALTFTEKLPLKTKEVIGEDGSKLSGGQRQRLSIARALYKNAPILILDEATSALDNESERQIKQALDKLKKGRTTLVIAHRLSTIENADKIVVMDSGQIVEIGSHQELLKKKGTYFSLYHSKLVTTE